MTDLDFQYTVEGLDVSFSVTSKVPAKAIFNWDFGDDKEAYNQRNPSHSYEKSGFYTVTLTVETADGSYKGEGQKVLIISSITKTHLTDSIYNLINEFIPHELSGPMTNSQKSLYINKWQLYIAPLVNRPRGLEIPLEHYNDELYYEGLENQLVMELAAWDYLNVKILNILTGTGQYLRDLTMEGTTEDEGFEGTRGDRVKRIQTGPTEVEYYDSLSEATSTLFKAYSQAVQPGGVMDELRKNLCMLASRLSIYLPFCSQSYHPTVPYVVNRRNPGPLGGPNPTAPLNRSGSVTILPKRRK